MGLKSTGITNLFVSSYGNYYWKAKINGSVRQGTLGTKSMSTAKSRLYRRLQAGKRQYQGEHHGKSVTLGDWAREWLRREKKRFIFHDTKMALSTHSSLSSNAR